MKIRLIHDLAALDDLRDRWRYVYLNDKQATVFQSWGWLRGWLGSAVGSWSVLVFESEGTTQPVGFFALHSQESKSLLRGFAKPAVRLAGDPLTDYSGILCLPEYEQAVISAIRKYISDELGSYPLTLREIADPRLLAIIEGLDSRQYSVQENLVTPCPRVHLPASWEQYLASNVERGFAKTLKRKLNKAARLGFVVIDGDDSGLTANIETFLEMSEARWGTLSSVLRGQFRESLISCYKEGLLEIKILSGEGRSVAIQLCLLDERSRVYHFYNGGRDPDFDHVSPGMVLHGHCIRRAIERGFAVYDFMRGAEPYKYSYGARDCFNRNFVVEPKAWRYRLARRAGRAIGSARKALRTRESGEAR